MMEADKLLAERLQSKEREELTDDEKAKLFIELMEKTRKEKQTSYQGTKENSNERKEKKVEGSEETAKGSRKKMLGRKRAGKE
ncbi:hypothetical protein Tco_0305980 [Tanacetum coccineum]